MFRALSTAATGMDAQQIQMEVIANNLANVSTPAFKRDQAHFEDLLYETLRAAGARDAQGTTRPTGLQIGAGSRLTEIAKSFSQGPLLQTGNPLDLAIEGRGFFRIQLPSGLFAYTRDGTFRSNAEGQVVTAAGDALDPPVEIPPETTELTIARDGTVTAFRADSPEGTVVAKIELVDFQNPAGLMSLGRNLYRETAASGQANSASPGTGGVGALSQGFQEQSNVKVVEEMISLITTQRAYEINSKVIQTADAMLQNATRIR